MTLKLRTLGFVSFLAVAPFFLLQCNTNSGEIELSASESSQVLGGSMGLATLNASAAEALNTAILSNASVASTLVRAQTLVSSTPLFETVSIGTRYYNCPEGGRSSFAGTLDMDVSGNDLSVGGDFTQTFVDCEVITTIEAEDGDCVITMEFVVGTVDTSYALEYNTLDESYSVDSQWTTSEPIDMLYNGEAHEIEFDVIYSADEDENEALAGTILMDGEEYDASTEIDTTEFTRSELGCE